MIKFEPRRYFLSICTLCSIISSRVDAFASISQWSERFLPNSEELAEDQSLSFLLDIDGISVSTGREHICAIEQNPMLEAGSRIGGNVQCWGIDYFGRLDAPRDVHKYPFPIKLTQLYLLTFNNIRLISCKWYRAKASLAE